MIADGAVTIAAAVAAAMDRDLPGAVVAVYAAEPDTAAPPCVWLSFVAARWQDGWQITFDATVVADAGLTAVDAQQQLAAMADAVLGMDCPGVVARDMTARGGSYTVRVGEVPHPALIVSVPQANQVC